MKERNERKMKILYQNLYIVNKDKMGYFSISARFRFRCTETVFETVNCPT